jgi:hypothetical protein
MSVEKRPDWVQWFRGQNFDVITLKEPDPGNWLVAGTASQDGFAIVLTDLKLLTDWPLVVRSGDSPLVQARLYENDKPVSLPEMNGVIQYAFQITPTDRVSQPIVQEPLLDDGKKGDKVGQDGIFSALTQIDRPGEYRLTVVAKGPTFQKSQQIPFTVRPRLLSLEVKTEDVDLGEADEHSAHEAGEDAHHEGGDSAASHTQVVNGDEDAELIVHLGKEAGSFRNLEVTIIAVDGERRKVRLPLKHSSSSSLALSTTASTLQEPGEYTLKAVLHGETKKGEQIEAESIAVRFSFRPRKNYEKPTLTPSPTQGERKDEAKKTGSDLPVAPLAFVTLANLMAAGAMFAFTKRPKEKGATARQKYLPQKQLIDALAALEDRVSTNKVELNNPIFEMIENERDAGVSPEVKDEQPTGTTVSSESQEDA